MPFWEYSSSASDDEELEIPDRDPASQEASPPSKRKKKALPTILDLESDEDEPLKRAKQAPVPQLVDDEDDVELARSLAQTQQSGDRGASARGGAEVAEAHEDAGHDDAEALRLQQMRAAVLAAFTRDEDDDDLGEDESAASPSGRSPPKQRRRRRYVPPVVDLDEGEDAEAELERARQAALAGVAARTADGGEDALVFKVQCKQGHVQIRQQRHANFEELQRKFLKYAVEQGWCACGASCALQFDGDGIDIAGNTPEELDMDNGEAIDAIFS